MIGPGLSIFACGVWGFLSGFYIKGYLNSFLVALLGWALINYTIIKLEKKGYL